MDELSREELISAYLDGELSAQEQERAEQLLATDPDARALLEELRALSATLQAMPRLKVDEDLSGRVLRRAERAMLVPQETVSPETLAAAAAAHKPELQLAGAANGELHVTGVVGERRGIPWRGVAWSALAAAAALLIMIAYPGGEPNVAKHDGGRAPQANASADKPATGVAEKMAPANNSESKFAESDAALESAEEAAGQRAAPMLSAQRNAAPAESLAIKPDANDDANGEADRDAQYANRAAKERQAASADPRPGAAAAKANRDELRHAARPSSEAAGNADDAIARRATAGRPAGPEAPGAMVEKGIGEGETDGRHGGGGGGRDLAGVPGVPTLVVNVTLSPAAAESGEFETLLAQHDIQWADESHDESLEGTLADKGERLLPADEAHGDLKSKNAIAVDSVRKQAKQEQAKRADAEGGASLKGVDDAKDQNAQRELAKGDSLANGAPARKLGDVELVYLVASQDQVDATLAELQQRRQEFQVSFPKSTDLKRTLGRLEPQQLDALLGVQQHGGKQKGVGQEQAQKFGTAQAEGLSRNKKSTGEPEQLADSRPADGKLSEDRPAEEAADGETSDADAAGDEPASELSEASPPAPRTEQRNDTKKRETAASGTDKRVAEKKSFAAGKGQTPGQAAELQAERARVKSEQERTGEPLDLANQTPGESIDGALATAPRGVARRLRMTNDGETWQTPGVPAPAIASRANAPKLSEAAGEPASDSAGEPAAEELAAGEPAVEEATPAPAAANVAPQAKAGAAPPAAPLGDSEVDPSQGASQLATRGAFRKQIAAAGPVRVLFVIRIEQPAAATSEAESAPKAEPAKE